MIIAQISDTHIALDTPDADRRIRDFERTVTDINSLDPQPDVIIHTGDIVQNGRLDEYTQAAVILEMATAPVYVMVGNKDDRIKLRQTFLPAKFLASDSKFVAYSIEDFPVRLVVLDTLNPGSNKGDFCEDRMANLINMLDVKDTKPIAVFAHHPPFTVPIGPDPLHFETEEIMQRLRNELQRSNRVIGVYCGHVHRGAAGLVGKIPILVMPCIATTLRRGDYPPDLELCPIYHIHRYEPDWGFTSEIRIVRDS